MRYPKGEIRSIADFVGGETLIENGQGVCTDCHAGENPFIVHPEMPAFDDLVLSGVLRPAAWYDPLIGLDPSSPWPENPGPLASLPGVPAGQRGCNDCHFQGYAGRFPNLAHPLPQYCAMVLDVALGGNSQGDLTMPPSSATGDYTRHVDYLQRLCSGEPIGGMFIEDPGPADDPDFLSPPTVLPMYLCATQIGVSRARLGAEVELLLDGVPVGSADVRDPDLTVFDLGALDGVEELTSDQRWTARQRIDGGPWSADSEDVYPVDVTEAYPSGIPAPAIVPTPVYDCAQAIAVTHLPGATLHVERSIGANFEWLGTPSGYSVVRPATAFAVTEQLSVTQSFCGAPSMTSETVTVDPEPYPIGPPVVPDVYEEQQLVLLTALTHGTTQNLTSSVAGPFASLSSWPTPVRSVDVGSLLARPLDLGEALEVTHGLCDSFASGTSAPALSCDSLPPAEIAPPVEGDVEVIVVGEAVPGSTIRVWVDGEEIGDSSGNVINLSRPVGAGETLQVMRELDADCRATTSFVIEVL